MQQVRAYFQELRRSKFGIASYKQTRKNLDSHRCGVVPDVTGDAAEIEEESQQDREELAKQKLVEAHWGDASANDTAACIPIYVSAVQGGGPVLVSVDVTGVAEVTAAIIYSNSSTVTTATKHAEKQVIAASCKLRLSHGRGSCVLPQWDAFPAAGREVELVVSGKGDTLCTYTRSYTQLSISDGNPDRGDLGGIPPSDPRDRFANFSFSYTDRTAQAATPGKGNLAGYKAFPPHQTIYVKGRNVIPAGTQVRIREGTRVLFHDWKSVIEVYGQLIIEGTALHPVSLEGPAHMSSIKVIRDSFCYN